MWKRIAAVCAVVLYIAALWLLCLIAVPFGLWEPLTRPSGVSWRAHYIPTLTSGAWFDCSVDRKRDVDSCKAWDDEGHLIAFGNYRLDGENRAATEFELRPSMVLGTPGGPKLAWIYLFKDYNSFGRTLVPVNGEGRPLERFEVTIGDGK